MKYRVLLPIKFMIFLQLQNLNFFNLVVQHMTNYYIVKIFDKITNNQKASKKNQLAAVSLNRRLSFNREKTLIYFCLP